MPRLEYKGCYFDIGLRDGDEILYIVVYTNINYLYAEKHFSDIKSALDFEQEYRENCLKLTFIYIKYKKEVSGEFHRFCKINFIDEKITLDWAYSHGYQRIIACEHKFDDFIFRIAISNIHYVLNENIHIFFGKRRLDQKPLENIYNTTLSNKNYNEFIPDFVSATSSIFLKILFLFDVMIKNYKEDDLSKLEIELKSAKQKTNENINLSRKLQNTISESNKMLSEQESKLINLIGLNRVKMEIVELKALAHVRKLKLELGIEVTPSTLHVVFSGNPGTGKTTVARLLGEIYYENGLLAENKVIEVSRADIVGEYIGQTAQMTKKVFDTAKGGILFIDEAYSLLKGGNDFGKEAIETLLKLMEDNRENIVIIIAGYPKEMEELLASNPGLRSRFSKHLYFEDFNKDELLRIFIKIIADHKHILTDGAKYKIEYIIDMNYETGYFNSNARSIRNIFETMDQRQAARLSKLKSPTPEELITYIDKDVPDNLD